MNKITIVFVILSFFPKQSHKVNLTIVTRTKAILISRGYALSNDDSLLNFKGKNYLIKSKEYFETSGNLKYVFVWKANGYLKYNAKEVLSDKKFLEDHDFSPSIVVGELDHNHIKINNTEYLIFENDKEEKIVYYYKKNDKNLIYSLTYK